MRHNHPRGKPFSPELSAGWYWCVACVSQGRTTFDELMYEPAPRRGKIKVGMTVSWRHMLPNPTGLYERPFETRTGQVWSLAEPDHRGVWSSGIEYWWVVDKDQKAYKVRQDHMLVLSEGQADASLV